MTNLQDEWIFVLNSLPLLHFFIEWYQETYVRELDAFMHFAENSGPSPVSFEDGKQVPILAETAIKSASTGQTVKIGDDGT